MQAFAYSRAASLDAAAAAAREAGTVLIAGGTELANFMKEGIEAPERVVDINGLTELNYLRLDDAAITIGALARMSRVARDPGVVGECPALAQAIEKSASQQIRNMASMGGNLLQRTRCPYFRAERELPCNKRRPGSGCLGFGGNDRTLAIFGGSAHCIATHPSDAAVALAALDAVVRVKSVEGLRDVPLVELYRLPGETPHVETVLAPGDVIVELVVPRSAAARRSCYLKLRERASYEFALVSVAAAVAVEEGTIKEARVALGGVAPMPWRLENAEAALTGCAIDDAAALERTLAVDFAAAKPGRHNGFKIELAKRATVRALQLAAGGAA